jgi:hypothetical protein
MSDEDDLVEWEDLEEWEDHESFEDRFRRGPLLGALLWTAIIAGAVWVVLNASIQIRTARAYEDIFSSEGPAEFWVWMQVVAASRTPSFSSPSAPTFCCGSGSTNGST